VINCQLDDAGSGMSFLKSSRLPISRPAASVGDSDDLDGRFDDPVNHPVGKTPEEKFPRAADVHRPTLRVGLDLPDGMVKFRNKSIYGPSRVRVVWRAQSFRRGRRGADK
jgi:hypothetical protein